MSTTDGPQPDEDELRRKPPPLRPPVAPLEVQTGTNEDAGLEQRWQFSLRAMLILLLITSALCMAIAPQVRDWQRPQLILAGIELLMIVVPASIAVGVMFLQERHTRARSGQLLFRVFRPGAKDRTIMLGLATVGVCMLAAAVMFSSPGIEFSLCVGFSLSLGALLVLPPVVVYSMTGIVPGQVDVHTHGLVVSGRKLIPWSHVTSWRTQSRIVTLSLHMSATSTATEAPYRIQLEVPDAEREQLERLLHERAMGAKKEVNLPRPEEA